MTTRIVLASTAFGLATAAAALRSGTLARCDRQILITTSTVAMPEAAAPMTAVPGVTRLCEEFDAVWDYNQTIEPNHPADWHPRVGDLPLWERHLRTAWELGEDDLHLAVESIAVKPALSICRIFADARVDVYADGLMSFGPTRNPLPEQVATRIELVAYLDLVPGLAPMLLVEGGVPARAIPADAFRAVLSELANDGGTRPPATRSAVVVGQYLAALELLTDAEEEDLYAEMIERCASAGYPTVVFKPHPSAPYGQGERLRTRFAASGVTVVLARDPALVETWYARGAVALVVGCFSTALLTAQQTYGIPAVRVGSELMLERLSPYENSNRIPVTLIDALIPPLQADGRIGAPVYRHADADLVGLVRTVSYAMQPELLADRRPTAVQYLAAHQPRQSRYFKRRRLTRLGLPGGLPERTTRQKFARLARRLLAGRATPQRPAAR